MKKLTLFLSLILPLFVFGQAETRRAASPYVDAAGGLRIGPVNRDSRSGNFQYTPENGLEVKQDGTWEGIPTVSEISAAVTNLSSDAIEYTDGEKLTSPKDYTATNAVFDAAYMFIRYTPGGSFSVSYTNSVQSTNTWDMRIECVGCGAYDQTWGFTNTLWASGDGTVSNANGVAAIALHGLSTNVLAGYELDGDKP